jgi:hypothetical protein
MKAEAHWNRALPIILKRRPDRQVVWPKRCIHPETMREREDLQEFRTAPVELRHDAVRRSYSHVPRKAGPRDSVNRQTVLVEMEERGIGIENNLASGGPVT